ncbi:hypothetical protein PCC9214_01238 [Planktothrix tepida]|uniref:Uncharacterized protein n=1 Tax=Planktothrix tepida PCC 9214 TaxID=671072 RepID=A0A1J1LGD8_9CYAN|nr:hypothetical protein [Planktothrix tepida]CAD5930280.1 hypothetical protein PCC9214_01238 [Planktothrix tepida]CUR31536.1 conserved exported hypothetical protein [Planktothrix tepida PCC 9214]
MIKFLNLFHPFLLTTGLSIGSLILSLSSVQAQDAVDIPVIQGTPAQTYTPGAWQPVARVNPNQPVTVTITNETGYNLETGLTTGQTNTQIPPGGSYTINNVPKNSNIVINSIARAAVLDYRIDVQDNVVNVTVKTAAGVAGDNAINIQDTGAIYIY